MFNPFTDKEGCSVVFWVTTFAV